MANAEKSNAPTYFINVNHCGMFGTSHVGLLANVLKNRDLMQKQEWGFYEMGLGATQNEASGEIPMQHYAS